VRRDIRFEGKISDYEVNFYSLRSELNRFYLLLSHRSESAGFTCETNKNGSEYSSLRSKFYLFHFKKANILKENDVNIFKNNR
jgi:hypothetical protein